MKNPQRVKRGIIIACASILLATVLLTILFGKSKGVYPDYSSYSADPQGCKALYLLAGQMGYEISRYERPSRFLPQNALLIAVKPDKISINSKLEVKYLDHWVSKGNTLLIIDDPSNLSDYTLLKSMKESATELVKYSSFSRGSGKVIYCSDLKGVTNSRLGRMQSGIDFIDAIDSEGIKDVLFNEYYHGFGARGVTMSDLLGQTGKLVIVQVVLGVLLLLLISAKRFGKPVPVFRIIKRAENENLFALSNLYAKSKSNALVLQMNLERMKKDLSRFLGSDAVLDDGEIIRLSKAFGFLSEWKIEELLQVCNDYIESGRIGVKKLHVLIARLEKVRKGIL